MLVIGPPPKAMTNIGAEIDEAQCNTFVKFCLYDIGQSTTNFLSLADE